MNASMPCGLNQWLLLKYPCRPYSRCVGRVISDRPICNFVCLCVRALTTWAINNTKFGRHAVHCSRSACTDTKVKRSKVKVMRLSHALPTWVAYVRSIWLLRFLISLYFERYHCQPLLNPLLSASRNNAHAIDSWTMHFMCYAWDARCSTAIDH